MRFVHFDCCYANGAICQLYHGENKVTFDVMIMLILCTRPTCWMFIVLVIEQVYHSTLDTLSRGQPVFVLSP